MRLAAISSRCSVLTASTASGTIAPAATTWTTGLPGGWRSLDVGNPSLSGGARVENGRWTVQGAGEAIWGSEDQFYFANKSADGDVTVVARSEGLEDTHSVASSLCWGQAAAEY